LGGHDGGRGDCYQGRVGDGDVGTLSFFLGILKFVNELGDAIGGFEVVVHVVDEGNGVDGVEAATRGPQVLEDGSGVDFGVIRGGVFERAHVRVVDYTEDELVRGA